MRINLIIEMKPSALNRQNGDTSEILKIRKPGQNSLSIKTFKCVRFSKVVQFISVENWSEFEFQHEINLITNTAVCLFEVQKPVYDNYPIN